MKFHPYSEVFTLLEGPSLDELAADIKANGLREKIWIYQDQILDGRNRFLACKQAKIKPEYREYTGDNPLAFVVSLNIHRRHLNESQRAMAAARISNLTVGSNQHSEPVPIGTTSKLMHVSSRSIKRANKVVDKGSKPLQEAVDSGEIAVSRAAAVVTLPKSEQLAAAKAKAVKVEEPLDDGPDEAELAHSEEHERLYRESMDKVIQSDDRLATAADEIKRLTELLKITERSRDQFMNSQNEAVRHAKREQSKTARFEKEIARLKAENEALQERVAIMEAA